jgi:hypothetical protein
MGLISIIRLSPELIYSSFLRFLLFNSKENDIYQILKNILAGNACFARSFINWNIYYFTYWFCEKWCIFCHFPLLRKENEDEYIHTKALSISSRIYTFHSGFPFIGHFYFHWFLMNFSIISCDNLREYFFISFPNFLNNSQIFLVTDLHSRV